MITEKDEYGFRYCDDKICPECKHPMMFHYLIWHCADVSGCHCKIKPAFQSIFVGVVVDKSEDKPLDK